jgi:hypothetical protein
MWEEEAPDPFSPDEQPPPDEETGSEPQFPLSFGQIPASALPHVCGVMDLYAAARTRAEADQQLSKLFNPEYYI